MTTATATGAIPRDNLLDGFRGVAACGVVFSHALAYRFVNLGIPGLHTIGRFADPVSEVSVQIFFVISGYIITTLLLKEEGRDGRPNLAAFYARRICRILPPFLVLVAIVWLLDRAGLVRLSAMSALQAVTFTCNTSLPDCDWWVAHSWSLAVEEQFYLVWPLLFILTPPQWRAGLLVVIVGVLLGVFIARPPTFHANALSFACIATGAFLATNGRAMARLERASHPIGWALVVALLIVGPFTGIARIVATTTPFLVAYLVFAARRIPIVHGALTSRPVLIMGAGSYSLYLWQQVFFARQDLYLQAQFPLVLLPVAVVASVLLVEKPFIKVGQRWSRALKRRDVRSTAETERVVGPGL